MIESVDILLRIAVGAGLGALVGFERQWRSRTAGLRTNTLVALGSALFVVMGAYGFGEDGDPTRVAAQVVSGIGFLGAGVIMKEGASIFGINTAATLWASAAVGALAGAGLIQVAIVGALGVVGVNVFLRFLARAVDNRPLARGDLEGPVEYSFEVKCAREDEVMVRAIVFAAIHRPKITVQSIAATDLPDDMVVITAVGTASHRNDHQIERAIADVIPAPEVLGVRWSVTDLDTEDRSTAIAR